MSNTDEGLTAIQVADRLGVELATVYAYASRGSLTRRPGPGGRASRYDPDEVELLAQRARPRSVRRGTGAVDVVIGTTISEIGDGWIRYRGVDLADLAGHQPYESVAHLLWTGELPEGPPPVEVTGHRVQVAAQAERAVAALPADAPLSSRLAVAVAAASASVQAIGPDPALAGLLLLDALVAGLPLVGTEPVATGAAGTVAPLAARLWPRLSPLAASPARLAALDLALVLLAEHELATSTLAVRVAASTRAGAAEAVLAGIGTVSGPLHGQAAVRVHRRLVAADRGDNRRRVSSEEADDRGGAAAALDGRAHADGFGHVVHRHGDPRFAPLHEAVEAIASPRRRRLVDEDLATCSAAGAPRPNVDAALGALGFVARAEPGMTEAVFTIARTAGWLAHAHEEADERPLRFRGRTLYRGNRHPRG